MRPDVEERRRVRKLNGLGILRRYKILRAMRNGPMTVRGLGAAVGLKSSSSVQAHIEILRSTGLIRHVSGWELTDAGRAALEE